MIITDDGTIIRTPVSSITTLGRNTQGVRIMRVSDSRVVGVARAEAEEDEPETNEAVESAEMTEAAVQSEKLPGETGEPDALDLLVADLEENPEPSNEDI